MPFSSVSLADIQVRLADAVDQSIYWSPEEARLAFNEAMRTWNLLTGRWRRTISLDTTIGGVEYALPSTLIYGMRVSVANLPLAPTSLLELDLGRPSWRGETVTAGGVVPSRPTLWAPLSLQQIVIWPQMASIVVGELVVNGVSATPTLTEDSDTADLSAADQTLLQKFALHLLAFKEGGPRWRATQPYFAQMLKAAAEENGILKANQKYRRFAGLDQRRFMRPMKGETTQLDQLPAQLGGAR